MTEGYEKIFCPMQLIFETYKNLANIGTGKYQKDSIQVYECIGNSVGKAIPFEIKDDILMVRHKGKCLLILNVEMFARVERHNCMDFNSDEDSSFMITLGDEE